MPHAYPSPPEIHVLRRLKHLVLNDDVPNEESIPEETNDSLAMGKKRGNYLCKECNVPLKGHVCPYRPAKKKLCYDRKKQQKIETCDKDIQTTEEESFLVLKWKCQQQKQQKQQDGNEVLLANYV